MHVIRTNRAWPVTVMVIFSVLTAACAQQQPASPSGAKPAAPAEPAKPAAQAEPAKPAASPAAQAQPAKPAAAKTKVTVAYLEDPSRHAVLYAIKQGLVKSDSIEMELSFLPLPAAVEAHQTKKFDIIETSPVAVAGGAAAGFKTLITSAALENKGGTLLLVPADSPLKDPKELKGKTIGLASLGGTFALEARYVLQEKYGLNTNPQGGDVRWQEVPPDVGGGLLRDKKLDALVALNLPGWKLKQERDFRELVNATTTYRELTGALSMNSVLLTYPEVAQQKTPAINEVNRMLRESAEYMEKNKEKVFEEVAKEKGVPAEFLKYFFAEAYNYPQGSLTAEHKKEITTIWDVAKKVGAVPSVPNIEEYTFKG